jgi:hypothetical protein
MADIDVVAAGLDEIDVTGRRHDLHPTLPHAAQMDVDHTLIEPEPAAVVVENEDVERGPFVEAEFRGSRLELEERARLRPVGLAGDDGIVEGRRQPIALLGGVVRDGALEIADAADASRRIALLGRGGGARQQKDRRQRRTPDQVLPHRSSSLKRRPAAAPAPLAARARQRQSCQ